MLRVRDSALQGVRFGHGLGFRVGGGGIVTVGFLVSHLSVFIFLDDRCSRLSLPRVKVSDLHVLNFAPTQPKVEGSIRVIFGI